RAPAVGERAADRAARPVQGRSEVPQRGAAADRRAVERDRREGARHLPPPALGAERGGAAARVARLCVGARPRAEPAAERAGGAGAEARSRPVGSATATTTITVTKTMTATWGDHVITCTYTSHVDVYVLRLRDRDHVIAPRRRHRLRSRDRDRRRRRQRKRS